MKLRVETADMEREVEGARRQLAQSGLPHILAEIRDLKLRGKGPCLPITDNEWKTIGEKCVAEKLSGRSVDHLAGRVLTEIEDFEEPDAYFSLSFEDKQKVIAQLSKPVGAERIRALIEEYCRFEREAQEKSETERFIKRVREIRFHLSTQRAALGVGVESPAE